MGDCHRQVNDLNQLRLPFLRGILRVPVCMAGIKVDYVYLCRVAVNIV